MIVGDSLYLTDMSLLMNHRRFTFTKILFLLATVLLLAGCAEEQIVFHEVKHPHERLKVSELNQYLRIIKSLPDKKPPALPSLFTPVPQWDSKRELSIKGLIKEEKKWLPNRWFSEAVLAKLSNNRRLINALKKENLSVEQFLGLTETIAMAAARTHYENVDELRVIVRTGKYELSQLMKLEGVFSSFPEEEQYEIIRSAAWLSRLDRARNLLNIPDENVTLLRNHWDVLKLYLPADALQDPLADIVDALLVYGIPFEEEPVSGFDNKMKWSPNDETAYIGRVKNLALPTDSH